MREFDRSNPASPGDSFAWRWPQFRLWHLVGLISGSALVFGAARALGDETIRLNFRSLALGLSSLVFAIPFSVGAILGSRAGARIEAWASESKATVRFLVKFIATLVNYVIIAVVAGLGLPILMAMVLGISWIIHQLTA